jgi:hypothetical protein
LCCLLSLLRAVDLNLGKAVNWWDEPDELGEGDLGGAAFGEGSGCEPLATGGDPLPQLGTVHGEAVEKETVGTAKPLKVKEHNPPSPERRSCLATIHGDKYELQLYN